MAEYYYVVSKGRPCGHQHRTVGGELAKCWKQHQKGTVGKAYVPQLWKVDADGNHAAVPRARAAEAVGPLLPTRKPGRPAGQKPRIPPATPLYVRLSADQRQRYEAAAAAAGFPDLGKYAVALMELGQPTYRDPAGRNSPGVDAPPPPKISE